VNKDLKEREVCRKKNSEEFLQQQQQKNSYFGEKANK